MAISLLFGPIVGAFAHELETVEFLFSPDVFIVGGGVSKRSEEFFPYLETDARIMAAELQNRAGVVGAAWFAANKGAL